MNELALFAGAGGGILGGKLLGWRTVCAVEINAYCARRLMQRQNEGHLPPFPIWDDVCTFNGREWLDSVDVVSGGFPCQDISSAGLGAGITGSKSGLWSQFARVIWEVRPRYAYVENSPLLTKRGIHIVLRDLAEMGYDAQWGVLGASHAGGPHKRHRIWIVAHSQRDKKRQEPCGWPSGRMGRVFQSVPWNESCESALSRLRGMDDGLARVVDRTDAIRNGQVPIVAATAWTILNQLT
jgi:DNA (cytosine-5)-methyltransferase 1